MGVPSFTTLSLAHCHYSGDSSTHSLRGFSQRGGQFSELLGPLWEKRAVTSFLTTMCRGNVPIPLNCYVQLRVLLHAVFQQPQEISTAFVELLLKDSEEMGSEKLNNLSKMTMLTLLLSTSTHL